MANESKFTLSAIERALGIAIAAGTIAISIASNYVLTNWRLTENSQQIEAEQAKLDTLNQSYGNIDSERRITNLEQRENENEKNISEINDKLDVSIALLHQIEDSKPKS